MSCQLDIRLQNDRRAYAPGDTIIGCVWRNMHLVLPSATIKVWIRGRASFSDAEANTEIIDLFEEEWFTQTIHDGPLHIPRGGAEQAWPFTIKLPISLNANPFVAHSTAPERAWNHHLHDKPNILPATFAAGSCEFFIDYSVRAELRSTMKSSRKKYKATEHLKVVHVSSEPPITDFQLRTSQNAASITSLQLLPTLEKEKFKGKLQRLCGFSQMPTFSFNLELQMPSIIQLDNPTPLPMRMRLVPVWEKSTEAIQGLPQKAELRYLRVLVRSTTNVNSTWIPTLHQKTDLGTSEALDEVKQRVYIPCTDECPLSDLGELLNVRIRRAKPWTDSPEGPTDFLFPSASTYTYNQTHELSWKVGIFIAGKKCTFTGQHELTVLKPSGNQGVFDTSVAQAAGERQQYSQPSGTLANGDLESWSRPPEDEPLPRYE